MDENNWKIITELQQNGRATLKELAEATGLSSMGTKKKLQKMISQNVIKISALINSSALALHPAVIMLEMESTDAIQNLINRFKDCPRVVHIFKTIGGYNIIALVIAENQTTLESISVEKCSLRSSEGIRRSEFYPIGEIYFSPFLPVREHLTHKRRTRAPCNVDCSSCTRFQTQKCVGCPATTHYRGTL
ncbi:MAG: winged helix-turn-helix transcriptional regulator [Candidatus Bathyarchaeia archaeon]